MPPSMKANQFIKALRAISSPGQAEDAARFFKGGRWAPDNKILGVSIGRIFPVAKAHREMPLTEVEKLLDDPHYEVRMGAVAIMDFQAQRKSAAPQDRKALFDLYRRRHDRINNWDLVDRAAIRVVGGYLAGKALDPLHKLARSKNPWERRTAIVATAFFLRSGEVEETFAIAEVLVHDEHEYVQKAVGSWLREAGKKDPARLLHFLDKHAATMPRPALRLAVEKLEKDTKARYMGMGRKKPGS